MKKPLYKRILSYLFDINIESLSSDYNRSLDLVLSDGRYQLLTEGAIYSYEDKYDNFRKSFQRLDIENQDIDEVLILGFGLGSIPVILERCFGLDYHFTAVEIDASVIYLYSKYISDNLRSNIEIIEADAHLYMLQNSTKYDMICMDVFIGDQIPGVFKTIQFLESIKQSLNAGGLLMFNWLAVSRTDIQLVDEYMKQVFTQVFPSGYIISLNSNRMLIGRN